MDSGFEQLNEGGIHEFIVIWNVEAHDPFVLQVIAKSLCQFATVCFLHDKNDVGPVDLFGRQQNSCAG